MDIVGAALLLVVAALPILAIAALVALDGGRPLFAHRRVGRGGRSFLCWKIRTMRPGADAMLADVLRDPDKAAEWERGFKLANDPRVTRIGAFLRRTSLDELPQLWNVLRGDMSLVGPRPITRDEMARYGWVAALYCSVRPGVTGLWQVAGRSDVSYRERVEIDRHYIETRSILGDMRVLLMTLPVLVRRTGR